MTLPENSLDIYHAIKTVIDGHRMCAYSQNVHAVNTIQTKSLVTINSDDDGALICKKMFADKVFENEHGDNRYLSLGYFQPKRDINFNDSTFVIQHFYDGSFAFDEAVDSRVLIPAILTAKKRVNSDFIIYKPMLNALLDRVKRGSKKHG